MLLNNLFEALARTGQGKTAVIGWGRGMGHKGHMMLASSVITKAKEVGGDPYFVVSRTVGKEDPLTADEKLAIYKKVFPQQGHIFQAASDDIPNLTFVLTDLNKQGYDSAVVVVGADQVKAFQYLKNYNNKPDKSGNVAFKFKNLEVISRQETGDPSAGEEGPRATPMRAVLNDPAATPQQQFQVWRDAMSPEVSDDEVRDLMAKAKERMGQFAAPKKKGVAEGAPIVVMPSPERLKKAEPTKVRYQGDIVPPTKPPSTEKRGVKGRPGQRPMPKYDEAMMPTSVFAGTPKNKLGSAGQLKGKMKRPAKAGDLVGDASESVEQEHIVKVKGGYELKSKHGNKNLGKYPTKAGAEKRERQVQYFKHAGEDVEEEKQKGVDGKACWKGYKRMGTKKKGGRTVDNCVKVGEGWEQQLSSVIKLLENK
jgi:hypothetical protein